MLPLFPEQYSLFIILAPIATLITVGVIFYAWRYRKMWETTALIWLLATVTGWLIFNTLETAAGTETMTLFWAKVSYPFIAATPVAWLFFALRYSGQQTATKPTTVLLFCAIPAITSLLAFTNESHRLLWQAYEFVPVGTMLALRVSHGPWFWIHAAYSYTLILVSAGLIIRFKSLVLYRWQSFWLMAGALIPLAMNFVYVVRLFPRLQKDYTPISFALAGLCFAVGMFRYHLFDLKPIAREVVLERMLDAVFIVDPLGRLLDLNPAAHRLIGHTLAECTGQPLAEIIPVWQTWTQALTKRDELQADLVLDYQGELHDYGVQISTLRDPNRNRTGWMLLLHDITNRKQAAAALRASETRYKALVQLSPDAIFVYRDGVIVFVNAATGALMGAKFREELLGKAFLDFVHPDYRDMARKYIVDALIKGKQLPLSEQKLFRLDGSLMDAEVTTIRIEYEGQGALLTIVRDITDRKRVENITQLRLRLHEFAAAHTVNEVMQYALDEIGELVRSPIGFYHFVEEDQKTLSLQAWSTRTAQEFCQAEGKGMHYSLDVAGVWVDCVRQRRPVIHNDYATLPHRKGLPPGHAEVKRELVVPTLRDGRIVSILGVGNKAVDYDQRDVTLVAYVADVIWSIVERKRTEAQLQVYQQQLEAQNRELHKLSRAIEQSASVVIITDPQGTIEYVNPAFTRITGYAVEEALGQNPRLLKSGQHPLEFYQQLWQTIRQGNTWQGELHNRRKDGSSYWESATIAPVLEADGEITNYIAIKENITARKTVEEALQLYAEQLIAQNAELDAFAHTVAHDLKNPLGIVMGYADLLAQDYTTLTPTVIQNALSTIARSSKKINSIIEALLLLAGVRKVDVPLVPVNMSEIVQAACERLQLVIEATHAQLTIPEPAAWPTALGYAPWLEEVWDNYISNALKYGGDPPEVELGFTVVNAKLPASTMKTRPLGTPAPTAPFKVVFWVRDNGPGLTPEAQAQLFVPFSRLGQTEVEGHGLGLSIVQRIVEKLRGEVGVASTVGEGSRFWFTLPGASGSAIMATEKLRLRLAQCDARLLAQLAEAAHQGDFARLRVDLAQLGRIDAAVGEALETLLQTSDYATLLEHFRAAQARQQASDG